MPPDTVRLYEIARQLGVENKMVLHTADSLGIAVKAHSTSISRQDADRVIETIVAVLKIQHWSQAADLRNMLGEL